MSLFYARLNQVIRSKWLSFCAAKCAQAFEWKVWSRSTSTKRRCISTYCFTKKKQWNNDFSL